MKVLLVLLFVAVAYCSKVNKVVETKHVSYGEDKGYAYTSTKIYHGKYQGKCGNDGFYYNDYGSFVICSSGNAYIQPCAPGSRNSPYEHYQYGTGVNYRDFCDINLVDDGYGAKAGYYGRFDAPYYGDRYHGYVGYQGGYGGPSYVRHGYGDGYVDPGYQGYNTGYGYAETHRSYQAKPAAGYYGSYEKTEYNPKPYDK